MEGYKVCLKVERFKDCLVSSELIIFDGGSKDDKLQELGLWPMKGSFAVKLFGNNIHYLCVYTLQDEERCTKYFEQYK